MQARHRCVIIATRATPTQRKETQEQGARAAPSDTDSRDVVGKLICTPACLQSARTRRLESARHSMYPTSTSGRASHVNHISEHETSTNLRTKLALARVAHFVSVWFILAWMRSGCIATECRGDEPGKLQRVREWQRSNSTAEHDEMLSLGNTSSSSSSYRLAPARTLSLEAHYTN